MIVVVSQYDSHMMYVSITFLDGFDKFDVCYSVSWNELLYILLIKVIRTRMETFLWVKTLWILERVCITSFKLMLFWLRNYVFEQIYVCAKLLKTS